MQPFSSDVNAVGNSVNMMDMLSTDRLICLESESIVRLKERRASVTEAVSLSLTAFSDVCNVLQEVSVKQMNSRRILYVKEVCVILLAFKDVIVFVNIK